LAKKITIPILFIFLLGVAQIPVWSVRIPPLVDYPNHLARMHVLTHYHETPLLQKYYLINWAILPNLAMDAIVPVLAKLMPLEVAGKCFIILIFLLLVSGTFALHYTLHRELSLWPLLSFLFLYNRPFLWGFMNFLFGVGLSLWLFAGWIHFRERSPLNRTVFFGVLALVLFFSHLYAFGIYALCILGYEYYRMRQQASKKSFREYIIIFPQFFLPAILLLFFCPTTHSPGSIEIIFGNPLRKIYFLLDPVNNYNAILDISTFLILSGSFCLGVLTGTIRLSKELLYPLVILSLSFLAMPELLLTVWFADMRIPTAFVFLLIAGSELTIKKMKWRKEILAVILTVFIIRMSVVFVQWRNADQEYSQYLWAINKIDEGSRLFTAIPVSGRWRPFPVPINHLPCFAIIEKSAFVPSLFTHRTQQPVSFTAEFKKLALKTPEPFKVGLNPTWDSFIQNYDYLLVVKEKLFRNKIPSGLRSVYHGNDFRLLRTCNAESKHQ